MLVDVIYPGWVPFANIAMSKHIPGFMAHHDHTLAFDFDKMITGHLNRLGTREDVLVQREYMHDIRDAAQHALELTEVKRDMSRDLVGKENIYVYFKTMYDAASAEAAQPVIEKWRSEARRCGHLRGQPHIHHVSEPAARFQQRATRGVLSTHRRRRR